MRAAILCFTGNGLKLARRAAAALEESWDEVRIYGKSRFLEGEDILVPGGSLTAWAGEMFAWADGLCFVGAVGIAVRLIAPWIRDKKTDPAVVVMDEKGGFCIPILSGHMGGANELALELSGRLGMLPVITTATDRNQRFAVDVFAKKQGMQLSSMTYAKEVSAALLAGETVGFCSQFPVRGKLPQGLRDAGGETIAGDRGEEREGEPVPQLGISVSTAYREHPFRKTLWLIPPRVVVGIGCRKGTPASRIRELVTEVLKEEQIFQEAVGSVATIDLKKSEGGLLAFCRDWGLPLYAYSGQQLSEVEGDFTKSDFVQSVTGVDNVCERSAMLAAGRGKLIHRKTGRDGVTVALALENWSVDFE